MNMDPHAAHGAPSTTAGGAKAPSHYRRLALMALVSFAVMYVLMYAMVDSIGSVYMSSNQVYMAGLMAAPMVAIELALMGMMYRDRRLNAILIGASLLLTAVLWMLIRTQAGIGDRQFLRSMIPHHSGAILMCGKAKITDPRIKALCADIMVGQRREIDQMKALLAEGAR
ncbi:DUF305 domain-containing protein [Cognatilysobacter terrigena]|uniref:DUF305 domain-containing protein n=1 Tax=Cognatilysobacter terrigena TaxID=2488749 RepID=UPI001FE57556|nr:DUF305 domain-containing protein [Lysobacter terrigena]